jgi:hypothetical protein
MLFSKAFNCLRYEIAACFISRHQWASALHRTANGVSTYCWIWKGRVTDPCMNCDGGCAQRDMVATISGRRRYIVQTRPPMATISLCAHPPSQFIQGSDLISQAIKGLRKQHLLLFRPEQATQSAPKPPKQEFRRPLIACDMR